MVSSSAYSTVFAGNPYPASLGEKVAGTAKVIAEPYARVVRGAYRALRDHDFAFGKPVTDK